MFLSRSSMYRYLTLTAPNIKDANSKQSRDRVFDLHNLTRCLLSGPLCLSVVATTTIRIYSSL